MRHLNRCTIWRAWETIAFILGVGIVVGVISGLYVIHTTISILLLLAGALFLLTSLEGLSLYLLIWALVLAAYIFEFGAPPTGIMGQLLLFSLSFSLGFLVASYRGGATPSAAFETAVVTRKWMAAFYAIQSVAVLLVLVRAGLLLASFGPRAVLITWSWRTAAESTALEKGLLGYGPILVYLSLVLGMSLSRFGFHIPRWLLPLNLALLVLVMLTSVSARRNFLFESVASVVFIYLYGRGNVRALRQRVLVLAVAIAVVLFFSWSQSLLGKSLGSARADILSYVTWNLENARYYMKQEPRLGSRALYLPALAFAAILGLRRPEMLNPINDQLGGYNTLPYFTEWYVDIGYLGTLLFSFVWGYICAIASSKASQSPPWLVVYGLLQTSILFSFRTSIVTHFDFVMMICILVVLNITFSARRQKSALGRSPSVCRTATCIDIIAKSRG